VNATGMICLPIFFGDKLKANNLEVDFLVIDALTTQHDPRTPDHLQGESRHCPIPPPSLIWG